MIGHLIAALIDNYMTTCFAIGLVVGVVQVLRYRGSDRSAAASGLLLNTFVFWAVGVAQAVNFVMHSVSWNGLCAHPTPRLENASSCSETSPPKASP